MTQTPPKPRKEIERIKMLIMQLELPSATIECLCWSRCKKLLVMALIIPTAYSTFADSSPTEGGALRKYVLAQFRSDAHLAWVADLRSALVTEELKYKHFKEARPRLKLDRDLWSLIEKGVSQATVIVTDPEPVAGAVRAAFISEGRDEGHDFDNKTVMDGCATALVAGTPLAHLPNELLKLVDWGVCEKLGSLDEFTPDAIRSRIGKDLRKASIFAARAHAIFDVAARDNNVNSTRDTFRSPLANVILKELMSTERIFDIEDPATAELLNDASDAIANFMSCKAAPFGLAMDRPLVREVNSMAIDHLQAADIAAGWARDILDTADVRALAQKFERIWLNGVLIKRPQD